jgi:hypothetical protein
MLIIHHKPEDAASGTAAKAVKRLPGGIHMKGGTLLLVKGAESSKTRPCTLEWKIASDDLSDIAGFSDFLDTLFSNAGHRRKGKRYKAKGKKDYEILSDHATIMRTATAVDITRRSQSNVA